MGEVKFSAKAYCKILLHCAKYPHCAVNGVLLAARSKHEETKTTSINYLDAIPLFHLCLQLTPMSEIALTQVELWARSVGLVIAGYYFVNEGLDDQSIDRSAHKIADKISELYESACVVTIDNRLITATQDNSILRVLQYVDKKLKPLDKSSVTVTDNTLQKASALIQEKAFNQLIDFDNHLDNIALHWQNTCLNRLIEFPLQKDS